MIFIQNIAVFFSGVALFEEISFNIYTKDKIGLVGKNGVGKSTILKLLYGQQNPSHGKIIIERGRSIGYLPQELAIKSTKSIKDEVLSVFEESIVLEKRIKELEHLLTIDGNYSNEEYMAMAEELSNAHQHLDLLDVSNQVSNVEKVLRGIGFKDTEFDKPVSALSGGWQMRVELAKLLIKKPDLLLLDEPTNHLDIESILWTEKFLKNYPGAIVIISHDKTFLDQVTNRTIEIVNGRIYDYPYAYSDFLSHREERIRLQQAAYNNQQKYIEQQERFIERFKAKASKARQAQSKQKQLDKIERIELDERDTSTIRFEFPPAPRSGEVVVKAVDVRKAYGEKEIFKEASFTILRGEKIAFVGKNGQGKTTMLKLLNKKEDYQNGDITIGYNVKIGYYAQQQEKELDENITVLQTVEIYAKDEWSKDHKKRALLGAFLFDADDIDKKVKVLSGGEKSRLALACLLLQECNVLILDEPTNHLDIASKEVLKNALVKFNGTLIVVSHDRDFLDGLTKRSYEFSDGRVKEYIGDIQEFLNSYQSRDFREFELQGKNKKEAQPIKEAEIVETPLNTKDSFKELKRIKNAVERAEKKVEELEQVIRQLENEIASNPEDKDLYFKHAENQKNLQQAMLQWEQAQQELEKINT